MLVGYCCDFIGFVWKVWRFVVKWIGVNIKDFFLGFCCCVLRSF